MGGFSIGYGISVSPRLAAFDPDALAYFTTAGITDNTAKTQINDFVKGIKSLGLWNSMVSWPLRSSQNIGTGTTAYSLGGLGVYNGTLNNNPTWATDGVNMETSTQNISTGLSLTQPFTIFAVFKTFASNGAGTTQRFYGPNLQGSLTKSAGSGLSAVVNASAGLTGTIFTSNPSTFYGTQIEYNAVNSTASVNGASKQTFSLGTANNSGLVIGDSVTRGAITSFVAAINTSSASLLYETYKSTLGQGLGLA